MKMYKLYNVNTVLYCTLQYTVGDVTWELRKDEWSIYCIFTFDTECTGYFILFRKCFAEPLGYEPTTPRPQLVVPSWG